MKIICILVLFSIIIQFGKPFPLSSSIFSDEKINKRNFFQTLEDSLPTLESVTHFEEDSNAKQEIKKDKSIFSDWKNTKWTETKNVTTPNDSSTQVHAPDGIETSFRKLHLLIIFLFAIIFCMNKCFLKC